MRALTDARTEYVDSAELAKIDTYFWGELCFYSTINDEFTGKGLREIPQFLDEVRAGGMQHGVEVVLSEESHGLTIEVRTQSPSVESRDMIVRVLEMLQRRYLCTVRDFRVPENIHDIWGPDFELGFATETDSSTAMGRRHFLQYAMNEQYRLIHQIESHGRVIAEIDETLRRYESAPNYQGQVMIHQLLRQDLVRQMAEMQQQLGHLELVVTAGIEASAIMTATRRQLHGVARPQFPLPVAGIHREIEWYGLDEPEQVRPSMCSTVADILYHPILRSALSRVIPDSGEGYEIELIKVLGDCEKLDNLLVRAKKILKRIDKDKGIADTQIEKGVRGLFALASFVKQFPDELFFDDLKSQKLRDVDFSADMPASLELANLIYGIRRHISKEKILSTKKFLNSDNLNVANAKKIKSTGLVAIQEATMEDGEKVYFVENSGGTVVPALYDAKRIMRLDRVFTKKSTNDQLRWFCLELDDKTTRYVTSDLKPAKIAGGEVDDAYQFEVSRSFSDGVSTYICAHVKNGSWYDYYPDSREFKGMNDLFFVDNVTGKAAQLYEASVFLGYPTLVSLSRKKNLRISLSDLLGKDVPDKLSAKMHARIENEKFCIGEAIVFDADLNRVK